MAKNHAGGDRYIPQRKKESNVSTTACMGVPARMYCHARFSTISQQTEVEAKIFRGQRSFCCKIKVGRLLSLVLRAA